MNSAQSSRIRHHEISGGIELIVFSDRNWLLVIVLTPIIFIWFLASIFIGIGFIINMRNGFPPFIWVCGWTAAGIFAIRTWLWHAAGKTKIYIQNNGLIIWRQNDIFSKTKRFELIKISNLHIQNRDIERTPYYIRRNYLFTNKTKSIAFEYEARTIRVVDWLNASDADFVLNKLNLNIHSGIQPC
jgi:hypothetical protein